MNKDSPSALLSAPKSHLIVIDVQEKLLPSIQDQQNITAAIRFLMDAAAILDVSVTLTEQYPQGLGPTVDPLRSHPAANKTLEKLQFSAAETLITDAFTFRVSETNDPRHSPTQIVLTGIETHVCVQQTALELCERGFQVFVAADCVGSRFSEDYRWGLQRMAHAGVTITTAESIAFEWCEHAGTDRFRALSRLIRARDEQRQL